MSHESQELTKSILFVEKFPNDWSLYGKTGGGYLLNHDGSRNQDRQIGWFIGWIEKGDRKIVFAHYIEDDQKMDSPAGRRAKEIAKEKLLEVIKAEGKK